MWKASNMPSVPITGELRAEIIMRRAVLDNVLHSATHPPG